MASRKRKKRKSSRQTTSRSPQRPQQRQAPERPWWQIALKTAVLWVFPVLGYLALLFGLILNIDAVRSRWFAQSLEVAPTNEIIREDTSNIPFRIQNTGKVAVHDVEYLCAIGEATGSTGGTLRDSIVLHEPIDVIESGREADVFCDRPVEMKYDTMVMSFNVSYRPADVWLWERERVEEEYGYLAIRDDDGELRWLDSPIRSD